MLVENVITMQLT